MEGSPTERAFRQVEGEFDALLAADTPEITAMGLVRTDRSTRTYHYKESYLRWEIQFERRWQRDLFTHQAQITLSYGEPIDPNDAPRVGIFRRAESFRRGQVSSIDDKFEDSYPIEAVRAVGFAGIIKSHLSAAAVLLDVTV
jgi:hypothetical protein